MPDGDLLNSILKSGLAVAMAIIGYFTKRTMDDVKSNMEKTNKIEIDHANYKTHVADNYAKDATVQSSLNRIHDRIDGISTDIKEILSKVGK